MVAHEGRQPLRVGVVKFASCDGCQLALLGLGAALLDLGPHFEIVEFGEASSNRSEGPFDVLLVEGSVSTQEQADHLVHLRSVSDRLVTIGACASAGGIQALRGWWALDEVKASVYPRPELISSLATATPIADHVQVDGELRGCPIDGGQLLELLTALSVGRRPQLPDEAVCVACKRAGYPCVIVARGEACLGPITHAGCGALCPAFGRGCYGCFGQRESPNVAGLAADLVALGLSRSQVARRLAGFTAWSPSLREAIDQYGGPPGSPAAAGSASAPDGVTRRLP
jgi:coenzyme F420-reducing hydrogenase gamma subunit